jgi:DnaJ-class molecular chaperone
MDSLLDRFDRLLRSWLYPDDDPARRRSEQDPDFQEAWRELDEYLQSGVSRHPGTEERAGWRAGKAADPDDQLRRDYANLEVSFGASLAEVTRSYKTLLKRFHPDRYASDAEKQRLATEITQRINRSYANIKETQRGKP